MKRILFLSVCTFLVFNMTATSCSPDNGPLADETETPLPSPKPNKPGSGEEDKEGDEGNSDKENHEDNNNENKDAMNRNMTITIGNANFSATLEDNPTAKAFAALLPMTINMTEMNGNEKYYNLSSSLPTETFHPGTIRTGDLLLWGSTTVVLFYKTFSSSYSYTRLGKIDNPNGLAAALGERNVAITFSFQ